MAVEEDKIQRIFAKIIIPGRGNPIYDGVVVIRNEKIDFVGTAEDYKQDPSYSRKVSNEFNVPILMPGLWDCHAHFVCTSSFLKYLILKYNTKIHE